MTTFNDPATGGGDKLPLNDLLGSLLLFTVREETDEINTEYGPTTAIRCDVAVLDGDRKAETFHDALIFPRVLKAQLRPSVGGMVLGRLGQGEKQPGKSAPWILHAANEDEKRIGVKYLAYASITSPEPAPAAEPF